MRIDFPSNDAIERDYRILAEYATAAATCISADIIRKRFMKHVPEITKNHSRHWGRDRWYLLDCLPKYLRDMVNDDPSNPDDALFAAVDLWNDTVRNAEIVMDRIVKYEEAAGVIDSYPDWLKSIEASEFDVIRKLRAIRLEHAERLRAEKERERREREEKEKNFRSVKERRYIASTVMEDWRVRIGNERLRLDEIQHDVRIMKLPPHLAREELRKRTMTVEKVTWVRPPIIQTYDAGKVADAIDNAPPLKFHPIEIKRGRNY